MVVVLRRLLYPPIAPVVFILVRLQLLWRDYELLAADEPNVPDFAVDVDGRPFEILGYPNTSVRSLSRLKASVRPILIATTFLARALDDEVYPNCLGNCKIVPEPWPQVDAILIVRGFQLTKRLLQSRLPHHYIVFRSWEAPAYFYRTEHKSVIEPYAGFYNLTMSYRRDSDVHWPYGITVKRASSRGAPAVAERRRPLVWMATNCNASSGRDQLVAALRRHIDVDAFGRCGERRCERVGNGFTPSAACSRMFSRTYRFYLALENAVCRDYVTEKFWRALDDWRLVPVVLSRAVVEPVAPPHSFIAADDFASPEHLAAHLHFLMRDDDAYLRYFDWRRNYDAVLLFDKQQQVTYRSWGMCALCRLLRQQPHLQKTQPDLNRWFFEQGACDDGRLVRRLLRADNSSA